MPDLNEEKTSDTSISGEIIPFGKYKGQPAAVLSADREYADWLVNQSWFRERYANFYTMIVNNFREPSETPEHNALQVLFLDKVFCLCIAEILEPGWIGNDIKVQISKAKVELAKKNNPYKRDDENWLSIYEKLNDLYMNGSLYGYSFPYFESNGADVDLIVAASSKLLDDILYIGHHQNGPRGPKEERIDSNKNGNYFVGDSFPFVRRFRIEIKPSVSDDYPAVLRQMLASRSNVLFLETYTGRGATEAQFVEIFRRSGIRVVFRRDVGR